MAESLHRAGDELTGSSNPSDMSTTAAILVPGQSLGPDTAYNFSVATSATRCKQILAENVPTGVYPQMLTVEYPGVRCQRLQRQWPHRSMQMEKTPLDPHRFASFPIALLLASSQSPAARTRNEGRESYGICSNRCHSNRTKRCHGGVRDPRGSRSPC